jgi:hypothetical protein
VIIIPPALLASDGVELVPHSHTDMAVAPVQLPDPYLLGILGNASQGAIANQLLASAVLP